MTVLNNQEERHFFKKYPFFTFIIFTFIIGAIGYLPWVLSSYGIIPFLIFSVYLGGLSPFLGALIASRVVYGKKGMSYTLKQLGLNLKTSKLWIVLAISFPIVIQFIAMGLYVAFIGPIDFTLYNYFEFIPAILVFSLYASGEEFGWRAFGQSHLQLKHSIFISSLILAVYWASWHWPHFILKDSTMLELYGTFYAFIFYSFLNSIYYAWFYNKSKANLLTCIFLHGTENAMLAVIPINIFIFILVIKTIIVGVILIFFRKDFFSKDHTINFNYIREKLDNKQEI